LNDNESNNAEIARLVSEFRTVTQRLRSEVGRIIVGQDEVVEHLLITLLVGGHCLVTGMPGTAKTLLVRTLSDALGLQFDRIQFTPDLMPTDITGTDIIEEDENGKRSWRFIPGPIFTNVLLADEINRTPPKTQAALLEAMQEYSATVRGTQHIIEKPFFVLLPLEDELTVVQRFTSNTPPEAAKACTNPQQILAFQALTRQVPVSQQVGRYAVELVRATRPDDPAASDKVRQYVKFGASVRAALFITLAAKARALMAGRYHVTREDIDALAAPVLRHRVMLNYFAEADGVSIDDVLHDLVDTRSAA